MTRTESLFTDHASLGSVYMILKQWDDTGKIKSCTNVSNYSLVWHHIDWMKRGHYHLHFSPHCLLYCRKDFRGHNSELIQK